MLFYKMKARELEEPLLCPMCAAGIPKKEIMAFRPDITKDEVMFVNAARLKRPPAAPDPEKKE